MDNVIALDLTYPVRIRVTNGPNLWLVDVENTDISIVRTQPARSMSAYSQRDPRWLYDEYAGGGTFGENGCYTVAVAIILSPCYDDEPPEVARKLREAGAYTGALLDHPERIPEAYPEFGYYGPTDVSKDGPLRWHSSPADIERLAAELEHGPLIAEADFQPGGSFNQHFFVVEGFTPKEDDLLIIDPWDGTYTRLLERYGRENWDLARAIYGLRLLRLIEDEPECHI